MIIIACFTVLHKSEKGVCAMPQEAGSRRKVRAAALVAGDGAMLQAILDSMYFKELPNFELVAVISPEKGVYAMTRALNAGVPAYVVDPELFPTMTSHSMAVANKLRDMDIELVILAGYDLPLGVNRESRQAEQHDAGIGNDL